MDSGTTLDNRPTFVLVDGLSRWLRTERFAREDEFAVTPLWQIRDAYCRNVEAILAAKARAGYQIVFVEDTDGGGTLPTLRRATEGAARTATVLKSKDGLFDPGERPELFVQTKRLFAPLRGSGTPLEIGGLNALHCVFMSALGFAEQWYTLSLLAAATMELGMQARRSLLECQMLNNLDFLQGEFSVLENACRFDRSGLETDTNLVDSHLRRQAQRSMIEFA